MRLLELIEDWASVSPNRVAVETKDESLTYDELWRQATERSHHLGILLSYLPVLGHRDARMVVSFVSALLAGIPYVPFDTEILPVERRAKMLSLLAKNRPDTDTAYVIFTSGSTGDPKGVMVPREALDAFVMSTISVHDLPSAERWLSVSPWSFDLSVLDTWVGLATGGTVVTVPRSLLDNPAALMRFLEKTPIDNWVGTPSFADYCLGMSAFNSDRVSSPKRFFFCGEVLRPATVRQLYDRFPTALVYNMYGPTEACCAVTSTLITRAMSLSSPSLSCGKPYPTIEIAIDRADNTRPSDMGEVMLMGTQVARGYLGTPHSDKFAERDGRRSYRTGDLGILINGELYVAGRLDRQVKVNGYRVELAEIEFAIRALGAPDAAVVQLSDGTLKAYVREMSATNVRNGLRRKFPTYMVPKRIVRLDSFPLSANGKVDLQALRVM